MGIIELIILSVGLAMDAFAVAVCKGLSMPKMKWKNACIVGIYFGGFQALMPLIGYLLGISFQEQIVNIDHWITFILLGAIGINMIKEAISKDSEKQNENDSIKFKDMLILAVATSIDALAVGITFVISVAGVKIGNIFGDKYEKRPNLQED